VEATVCQAEVNSVKIYKFSKSPLVASYKTFPVIVLLEFQNYNSYNMNLMQTHAATMWSITAWYAWQGKRLNKKTHKNFFCSV